MKATPTYLVITILAVATVLGVVVPRYFNKPSSPPFPKSFSQDSFELAGEPEGNITIVVNIPATELIVYEDGIPIYQYPVAIGSGVYPTPEQESSIRQIDWNPWWYPPASDWAKDEKIRGPGDPQNPLGPVKLALSQDILMHGTTQRSSVGRPASHGCMRLLNEDAKALAWYLQKKFSSQSAPPYLEKYRRQPKKNFVVKLNRPVPVRLVYLPLEYWKGTIILYPDYYRRMQREGEMIILTELFNKGISLSTVSQLQVRNLAKHWPSKITPIPLSDLLLNPFSITFDPPPSCDLSPAPNLAIILKVLGRF